MLILTVGPFSAVYKQIPLFILEGYCHSIKSLRYPCCYGRQGGGGVPEALIEIHTSSLHKPFDNWWRAADVLLFYSRWAVGINGD